MNFKQSGPFRNWQRVSASQRWPLEIVTLEFPAGHDGPYHTAYGKGWNVDDAELSALGEATERHSGFCWGDESTIESTFNELGEAALHPNDCMCYSERQYANREPVTEESNDLSSYVPEPFDAGAHIKWVALNSLNHNYIRYLPAAFCYYRFEGPGTKYCTANSNGCAAGSSFEDAAARGLLELIERDAVALWWYNQIPRSHVNLDQIDDTRIQAFTSFFQRINRYLWVFDITSDFRIPVYVAMSIGGSEQDSLWMGSGAHPDPLAALHSALLELGLRLPHFYRHSNPFGSSPTLKDYRPALPAHLSFLWPKEGREVTALQKPDPALQPGDSGLLNNIIPTFEKLGLEVLTLDQSRPELQYPVIRVVVPRLRHFWRRFGKGRLYDVPVEMGWLPAANKESDLNPDTFRI